MEIEAGATALDHDAADALLRRQDALQREAKAVLIDLDLLASLARVGEVTRVGSSATGLMVQRDIDLCVVCDDWSADAAFAAARPLAGHPRVSKLAFVNETGPFTPPGMDEGYYWGVRYAAPSGDEWKLDVWFWPRRAPAPDIAHAAEVRRRLSPSTRLAILWIKDAHHRLRAFGDQEVRSVDVYEAVLDHGVRSPAAFAAFLAEKRRSRAE